VVVVTAAEFRALLVQKTNRQEFIQENCEIMVILNSVSPVFGYFDPGSGSLVMQALVGGVAGLFVFAKYLWSSAPTLLLGRRPRSDSRNLPSSHENA